MADVVVVAVVTACSWSRTSAFAKISMKLLFITMNSKEIQNVHHKIRFTMLITRFGSNISIHY